MISDKENAVKFLESDRGRWVISAALWTAMDFLKAQPSETQFPEVVADMEFLETHLFPDFRQEMEWAELEERCRKKQARVTRLKRRAKYLGYRLIKSRVRHPQLDNQRGYRLVDDSRKIVAGEKYNLTLEDLEHFLYN